MITQARFDLGVTIKSWRQELLDQPHLTPDDRREAEAHLCDTIAELRDRGMSNEESFWLARGCVGPSLQTAVSLPKPDPVKVWRERLFWMAVALLVEKIWSMRVSAPLAPMWKQFPHPGWLDSTLVFFLVPLLCLAVWLSRGRLARRLAWLSRVINSRLRFILIATLLVLPWNPPFVARADPDAPLYWLAAQFLSQSLKNFLLIPLAAWLMPAQYRKPAGVRPDNHARHPLQTMEAYGRFDLADAIKTWRRELLAQPSLTPDERRETETHLRDAVAELRDRGLDAEVSFWLARGCAGPPRQIAVEYLKADPAGVWRDRVFWMALAVLLVGIWTGLGIMSANAVTWQVFRFFHFRSWANYELKWLLFGEGGYYLLAYLPPLFLAVLLAKGRAVRLASSVGRVVNSRVRLIFFTMVATCALQIWYKTSYEHKYGLWDLKPHLWEVALIALVAWLMPAQYRKTPKQA